MIILGVVVSRVYGGFLARASEKYFMHLCYWKFGVTFGGGTLYLNPSTGSLLYEYP
jgi:conjugal transfer pilus assembly protein TraL